MELIGQIRTLRGDKASTPSTPLTPAPKAPALPPPISTGEGEAHASQHVAFKLPPGAGAGQTLLLTVQRPPEGLELTVPPGAAAGDAAPRTAPRSAVIDVVRLPRVDEDVAAARCERSAAARDLLLNRPPSIAARVADVPAQQDGHASHEKTDERDELMRWEEKTHVG